MINFVDNIDHYNYCHVVDNSGFRGFVNTDGERMNETYSKFINGHGVGPHEPLCFYHYHSNRQWYHSDCQNSRHAVYEYPARPSNFTDRGKGFIVSQ